MHLPTLVVTVLRGTPTYATELAIFNGDTNSILNANKNVPLFLQSA